MATSGDMKLAVDICATRQLELIRQIQHRLDATLWT